VPLVYGKISEQGHCGVKRYFVDVEVIGVIAIFSTGISSQSAMNARNVARTNILQQQEIQ